MQDDESRPSGGVAKHTDAAQLEPSMILKKLTAMLSHRSSEASVKKLLSDATILREWQLTTPPTHKQRDAMMKLGRHWHVPQKAHRKTRSPTEVAQDLEEKFIHTARQLTENKTIFTRSAAKPTQHGDATRGAAKLTQDGDAKRGAAKPMQDDGHAKRVKTNSARFKMKHEPCSVQGTEENMPVVESPVC